MALSNTLGLKLRCTSSKANNTPASGALKAAARPAQAPQVMRYFSSVTVAALSCAAPLPQHAPRRIEGPSRPRDRPPKMDKQPPMNFCIKHLPPAEIKIPQQLALDLWDAAALDHGFFFRHAADNKAEGTEDRQTTKRCARGSAPSRRRTGRSIPRRITQSGRLRTQARPQRQSQWPAGQAGNGIFAPKAPEAVDEYPHKKRPFQQKFYGLV